MGRSSRKRKMKHVNTAQAFQELTNDDVDIKAFINKWAPIFAQKRERDWQKWKNMIQEMNAIQHRIDNNWHVSAYQHGQLALFRALSAGAPSSPHDSESFEKLEKIDLEQVKAAGKMLNESGGLKDMYEAVDVWTPKSVHRFCDIAFHGIGDWLC